MENDEIFKNEERLHDDSSLLFKSIRLRPKLGESIKNNLFSKIRKQKKPSQDTLHSEKNGGSIQNLDSTHGRYLDDNSTTLTACSGSGEDSASHDASRLMNAVTNSTQQRSSAINVFDTKFLNLVNEISKDFSAIRCDIKTNSDKLDILRNDINQQISDENTYFHNEITTLTENINALEENNEILEYRLNERINELEDAYSSLNNMVHIISKQQAQHQQILSVVDKYLGVDQSDSRVSSFILKYLIPILIFIVSMSITAWQRVTTKITTGASTGLILLCVLIVAALFMFYF